jgi:hypothetical protein
LGIPDMRMLNICLLASWVQRYYDDEDKLWRKSIDCKYQPSVPNIFSCGMDPPFEKECCGVPRQQKKGFKWQIGSREKVRFWKHHWFVICSLAIQF